MFCIYKNLRYIKEIIKNNIYYFFYKKYISILYTYEITFKKKFKGKK